jgi:hypothetical protein
MLTKTSSLDSAHSHPVSSDEESRYPREGEETMTVHGSNMPHSPHGFSQKAAQRAAELRDKVTQEKDPPTAGDLKLMRDDPAAFNPDFIKKWKHLL